MTIITTTVGKNPLKEMESAKGTKMLYLNAVSKITEWSLFISKQTIQYHSNPGLCPNQ